ncbi:venom carboxylesterase-6 [Xylocopa sonorina]|uniref:venom carboxylesterase-6 n=1 Tax=Xylocopa sonorina TaxID=1818115 RepID=UPI00403B0466
MSTTKLLSALLFLGSVNLSWQNAGIPKVDTPLGSVSGYYKESWHRKKYEAYEGIPYAQPPVGELRFEPPVPVQKWDEELSATEKSSICQQFVPPHFIVNGSRVTGSEDCLYLNIYVPIGNNDLLPVLVWVPGGAFQFGSGNKIEEKLLMDRNVILVTFNYRLGPFGFLSTGDSVVPGNMGLKDQSMALRWVFNNIRSFGGDPKNVTIFGASAGGISVHYHYLSPLSAGLFQRGISISGVALNPLALVEGVPEKSKRLAELVECPTSNVTEMVRCLKTRPAPLLSQVLSQFLIWMENPPTPFGPVIEEHGPNSFISRSPFEIISRGEAHDVPWVAGVVSEEGLFSTAAFILKPELVKELNDNWVDIAPHLLDYNDTIPVSQHRNVAQRIRQHYLGSNEITKNTLVPLSQMIGDRTFVVDFEKAARLQAKANKSPVWTYYYSYKSTHSFSQKLSNSTTNFGVCHCDDILTIIDQTISNTTKPMDIEMQELLIDFYMSFTTQGEPRIGDAEWPRLNPDEEQFRYLHIASPKNISMSGNYNLAEKSFWNTIDFMENKIGLEK